MSGIRAWCLFCDANNLDRLSGSIPTILSFLSNLFAEGLSYSSLNSYRSALSFLLGSHVGSDDRMKKFFRGVALLRPAKPKYNVTWDVDLVFAFFCSQAPNEELPLSLLTKKLATLVALATGHRIQTLSLIDLRNISITSSAVSIRITDHIKTSGPGKPQPLLTLPFFEDKPMLCPARCVIHYRSRTSPLRGNLSKLFITFKKPFREASTDSIGRWIKQSLADSGIDTSVFGAHSTRHASSSKAANQGTNIDIIRQTAGWSKESSTFARFYQRPILNHSPVEFASAVFS